MKVVLRFASEIEEIDSPKNSFHNFWQNFQGFFLKSVARYSFSLFMITYSHILIFEVCPSCQGDTSSLILVIQINDDKH